MERTLYFATKAGTSIHKLSLPKTLLGFTEFDLSYFMEQAIEFGKQCNNSGKFPTQEAFVIRNLLKRCHPFFSAGLHTHFDRIVTDCIIDYMCRSRQITRGALWNHYISPENDFQRTLFTRLSEYRHNKAVNQWVNLVRIQGYARKKLSYIFDGARTCEDAIARARYFDLTFSVAAKELGCPTEDIGTTKRYNACSLPNAPFTVSKLSKEIYHNISSIVNDANDITHPTMYHEDLSDQTAMDIFSFIKHLPPPPDIELSHIRDGLDEFAQEIYIPCGFKAAIDLEFDKMLEAGLLLTPCKSCGRYFERDANYTGDFCMRKDEDGINCREKEHTKRAELEEIIPKTLDERCEEVCALVRSRIGDVLDEKEFSEWENYLTSLRRNIEQDYATTEELEAFLSYSERMYTIE